MPWPPRLERLIIAFPKPLDWGKEIKRKNERKNKAKKGK